MTKGELEAMTKDELITYAGDHDVEVQHSWLKDDIIKEILKGQKAAAKSEAKPDDRMDSTKHHEERKAKIQAENEQNQKVDKELAENQEIANFHGLPKEGETRDQLLDRIRKMRENPPETETEQVRSDSLQKEFDAEQKAGQEAVARAAKVAEDYNKALAKAGGEKNQ